MDESKGLYFIPMIARALESKDPKGALREAFDKIAELGRRSEFQEGFRQFNEFIKAAAAASREKPGNRTEPILDSIDRLIHDLATDTFDGEEDKRNSLIEALAHFPNWHRDYERTRKESEEFAAHEPVEIEVLRDGKRVGSCAVSQDTAPIKPIFPGWYTIRLSNGRVLWEGRIDVKEVFWADAHPEEDLPLAAETAKTGAPPTKKIVILDGELEMNIFAGLEAGVLTIGS